MDLRLGGIAAVIAFVLSFLIGLVSRSTMPFLIVWPLVFAAVFFVIFVAAKFLFSQFLPELLDEDYGANSLPGAVVNIMEGENSNPDEFSPDAPQGSGSTLSWQALNAANAANAARPDDSDKSLGDISTLSEIVARNKAAQKETLVDKEISTGIDQSIESDYTGMGDLDKISQSASSIEVDAPMAASNTPTRSTAKPVKSGSTSSRSDSDDTLPDLDSMAGVFNNASTGASVEEEPELSDYTDPTRRRKSANRDQSLEGDFSPKDIAEGIRTVLRRDKEE